MKTVIQTPTPNLEDSITFYSKLGFTLLSKENPVLFSDGKVLIEINPERFARAGIKLASTSWEETVDELNKITAVQ